MNTLIIISSQGSLSIEDKTRACCYSVVEDGVLHLNFTAFVVFVNRLSGPLAKTMQLRSSFFEAFADVGSMQARAFLEAKLARSRADPAAAQLRLELDGGVSAGIKRRREQIELFELDLRCAKARSEIAKADADAALAAGELKKVQIESYLQCFSMAARVGVEFDDRAKLQLRDMVGSVAPAFAADRRKEICVRSFLLSKQVSPKLHEAKFGKIVARLKRERLRAAGLPEALPTKTIEANGQVVEAKLYFEEDADLFDETWAEVRREGLGVNVAPKRRQRQAA